MDERVCIIDGLYHALGVSAGGEFSSEDVSLIYRKVFHYPSTTDDVDVAMKKVAGEDEGWSCVGEHILDVLLEMQKERERKEELYWSQQLLNMGKHNNGYLKDTQDPMYQQNPDNMHTHPDSSTFKHADSILHSGSLPSGSDDTDLSQTEHNHRCLLRLKRSARQCWARLVTEGVHSIAPRQWRATELEVRGHALGCLTPADLLSLLEMKYDVVTRLLYTEMLRQHYGLSAWETLLPWQQDKEKEGLEDLAERALGSGDLFRLTELPGAFRIYKTRGRVFPTGSSESSVQSSWSAMTVLTEAYASRQQEMDSLTHLSKRLDRESLKLLFLYIRLATFRAQTERRSYGALLAARQLWESWPCVSDTYSRQEMVEQWLHGDEEEKEKEICISASPQQAVLQLLVLKQKAEREYLLGLLHGVSVYQLEGQENQCPLRDKEKQRHGSLKDGCLRRLQQIRVSLQTHAPLQESSSQTLQTHTPPWPRTQPHQNESQDGVGGSSTGSANRWGECAVILVRQLTDTQEAQVSTVLPSLLHMSIEHLQVLRDKYRSEFQTQHFANLLNILSPDIPESSVVEVGLVISHSGPITELNSNAGLHNKSTAAPSESAVTSHEEPGPIPAAEDVFPRQDLCTGCGAALEELPYLEILCVSGTAAEPSHGRPAEEGCHEEEDERGESPRTTPQGYQKQGSLITLAWSKPAQCDSEAGSAGECCVNVGMVDVDEAGEAHMEVLVEPPLVQSVIQPVSTVEMHISKQQVENEQTPSEGCFQAHGFATENRAVAQLQPLVPSTEIQQHLQQELYTASNNMVGEACRNQAEVEVCSVQSTEEPWAHKGNELLPAKDHTCITPTTEVDFPEKKRAMDARSWEGHKTREPVSLMEREKTMRNLVDMQRKVEKKQQRDKDRQLLRVQERLSIVQNKKAEEDLLGLKQKETLEHLTHNLPQEDKIQQKTVVRARLEQLRRERSCVMQSKRDRNTAGFKELLCPVVHSTDTENSTE